jgi:UDP-N-acetylglucosamine 1-carboxyvinyltransferase
VIRNAAREPEVVDLAECLIKMGAKIQGAGTSEIVIEGVTSLNGASHDVMPDRIETGTYAMAVAMTGGDLVLDNTRPDYLQAALDVLGQAGAEVTSTHGGIRVRRNGNGIRPVDVTTDPFPGFPTDLQAQFMALMTRASGTSRLDGDSAYVEGVPTLKGAPVMATDLRASVSLVIAGLVADGETTINRVYHLDRGFEALEAKLARCGALIERVRG